MSYKRVSRKNRQKQRLLKEGRVARFQALRNLASILIAVIFTPWALAPVQVGR